MSTRIDSSDLPLRISCFGAFDADEPVCLKHCGLNFECAAASEHILNFGGDDDDDDSPVVSKRIHGV